jgi:hypothetical protein
MLYPQLYLGSEDKAWLDSQCGPRGKMVMLVAVVEHREVFEVVSAITGSWDGARV